MVDEEDDVDRYADELFETEMLKNQIEDPDYFEDEDFEL